MSNYQDLKDQIEQQSRRIEELIAILKTKEILTEDEEELIDYEGNLVYDKYSRNYRSRVWDQLNS